MNIYDIMNMVKPLNQYSTAGASHIYASEMIGRLASQGINPGVKTKMIETQTLPLADQYWNAAHGYQESQSVTGIGGGFTDRVSTRQYLKYLLGKESVRAGVEEKSNQMQLQALRDMLDVEKFNKQMDFQYQKVQQSRDMSEAQMRLQYLIANDQIAAQQEAAYQSMWGDLIGGAFSLAALFL